MTNSDSLHLIINDTYVEKGTAPYLFTISLEKPIDITLLDKKESGYITWKPLEKDTGILTIKLTVTDAKSTTHTIYHSFTVKSDLTGDAKLEIISIIKPYYDTSILKKNDTLSIIETDTLLLKYYIIDTISNINNYFITIKQSFSEQSFTVNDTIFTNQILHNPDIAMDTITVTVKDALVPRHQRADEFRFFIKHKPNFRSWNLENSPDP